VPHKPVGTLHPDSVLDVFVVPLEDFGHAHVPQPCVSNGEIDLQGFILPFLLVQFGKKCHQTPSSHLESNNLVEVSQCGCQQQRCYCVCIHNSTRPYRSTPTSTHLSIKNIHTIHSCTRPFQHTSLPGMQGTSTYKELGHRNAFVYAYTKHTLPSQHTCLPKRVHNCTRRTYTPSTDVHDHHDIPVNAPEHTIFNE
jgi:hypothetical protein